jgi:hypothetical protein
MNACACEESPPNPLVDGLSHEIRCYMVGATIDDGAKRRGDRHWSLPSRVLPAEVSEVEHEPARDPEPPAGP